MVHIRTAKQQELTTIIAWAAAEGWNPGSDDLTPFLSADPEGYLVLEEGGAMKAAISLVRHTPEFAFLGFYLVTPPARGQGLGWSLWQHTMARAKGTTVGLDGVVAQQDNYRKSGFVYAHANIRYGGQVVVDFEPKGQIVPADRIPLDQVFNYDEKHNPCRREAFMSAWLTDSETRKSLVFVNDDGITGLGTIRQCQSGFKIGPLFADNATIADQLFQGLAATIGGGEIFLDIPEPNHEAKQLCARYGLQPVFETARMYIGGMPELPLKNIFGITTFELG